jgi:hypothetical protein
LIYKANVGQVTEYNTQDRVTFPGITSSSDAGVAEEPFGQQGKQAIVTEQGNTAWSWSIELQLIDSAYVSLMFV